MATVATSKVTSKGQVTVPEAVRKELSIHPGDTIEWDTDEDGHVRVRKLGRPLEDLIGFLGQAPRAVTVEEMDEAVRERARAKSLAQGSGRRARR